MSSENQTAASPPGYLAGFITLIVVILGIVGWIFIGSSLTLSSFYASFLFLWYWATINQLDIRKFPSSMVGALVGVGLAWGVHDLPVLLGTPGVVLSLLLVLCAIYLLILEKFTFVFNPAMALYLTVIAAPALLETSDFREVGLATLIGGAFFAGFVFCVQFIASKFTSDTSETSA